MPHAGMGLTTTSCQVAAGSLWTLQPILVVTRQPPVEPDTVWNCALWLHEMAPL